MTNFQIAGLVGVGVGICGVAWGYDQYQKRKRERELFQSEIARLEEQILDVEQRLDESISLLHDKNEQNGRLLREITLLHAERFRLLEEREAANRVAFWQASA